MTGRLEACIRLAKKIGIKNKTVLDIGCSNGWFCKEALLGGAKEVYAIEPDPNKIRIALESAPKAIIKKGVAGKLEYPKNKFDMVTLFDVIEHVPKDSELLVFQEIGKVIKPNGHLLLSTPYNFWLATITDPAWYFGHRHYTRKKLETLLNKAGFKIKEFHTRGGFWEIISMWVLYISKWVFHMGMPFEEWLDKKRVKEFNQSGRTEIFLVAQKD